MTRDRFERVRVRVLVRDSVNHSHLRPHSPLALSGLPLRPPWPLCRYYKLYHLVSFVQPPTEIGSADVPIRVDTAVR